MVEPKNNLSKDRNTLKQDKISKGLQKEYKEGGLNIITGLPPHSLLCMKGTATQLLEESSQTTCAYDAIIAVKTCVGPTTLFGRKEYRGLPHITYHKVTKPTSPQILNS